jgi:hypothetical protein
MIVTSYPSWLILLVIIVPHATKLLGLVVCQLLERHYLIWPDDVENASTTESSRNKLENLNLIDSKICLNVFAYINYLAHCPCVV